MSHHKNQTNHSIVGDDRDDKVLGFRAPFVIQPSNTYHCSLPASTDHRDFGIATALYPCDLNGDGLTAEFLFYQYEACGVYSCAVVAYDPIQDRLVQWPFELQVTIPAVNTYYEKSDSTYLEKTKTILHIPLDSIGTDGRIKYIAYIGHGYEFEFHYDFKFDSVKGCFVGTMQEQGIN